MRAIQLSYDEYVGKPVNDDSRLEFQNLALQNLLAYLNECDSYSHEFEDVIFLIDQFMRVRSGQVLTLKSSEIEFDKDLFIERNIKPNVELKTNFHE